MKEKQSASSLISRSALKQRESEPLSSHLNRFMTELPAGAEWSCDSCEAGLKTFRAFHPVSILILILILIKAAKRKLPGEGVRIFFKRGEEKAIPYEFECTSRLLVLRFLSVGRKSITAQTTVIDFDTVGGSVQLLKWKTFRAHQTTISVSISRLIC